VVDRGLAVGDAGAALAHLETGSPFGKVAIAFPPG
jgi:hypothetical protein